MCDHKFWIFDDETNKPKCEKCGAEQKYDDDKLSYDEVMELRMKSCDSPEDFQDDSY